MFVMFCGFGALAKRLEVKLSCVITGRIGQEPPSPCYFAENISESQNIRTQSNHYFYYHKVSKSIYQNGSNGA